MRAALRAVRVATRRTQLRCVHKLGAPEVNDEQSKRVCLLALGLVVVGIIGYVMYGWTTAAAAVAGIFISQMWASRHRRRLQRGLAVEALSVLRVTPPGGEHITLDFSIPVLIVSAECQECGRLLAGLGDRKSAKPALDIVFIYPRWLDDVTTVRTAMGKTLEYGVFGNASLRVLALDQDPPVSWVRPSLRTTQHPA